MSTVQCICASESNENDVLFLRNLLCSRVFSTLWQIENMLKSKNCTEKMFTISNVFEHKCQRNFCLFPHQKASARRILWVFYTFTLCSWQQCCSFLAFTAVEKLQKLVCAMAVSKYVQGKNNIVASRKRELVEYPQDPTCTGCPTRKVPKNRTSQTCFFVGFVGTNAVNG